MPENLSQCQKRLQSEEPHFFSFFFRKQLDVIDHLHEQNAIIPNRLAVLENNLSGQLSESKDVDDVKHQMEIERDRLVLVQVRTVEELSILQEDFGIYNQQGVNVQSSFGDIRSTSNDSSAAVSSSSASIKNSIGHACKDAAAAAVAMTHAVDPVQAPKLARASRSSI
jgi:hypothetical protein